jgi:xylose isomerase
MIEDKALSKPMADRYAGWDSAESQKLLRGEYSLDDIAKWVETKDINPQPKSGKQELLENIVNRYV